MANLPNIFNANIAGQIGSAFSSLVFDYTLIKQVKGAIDPNNPTAGPTTTEESHAIKGFMDDYQDTDIAATLAPDAIRRISIFGSSLPGPVDIEMGDKIAAEGRTWTIVPNGISRDPAGALFTCDVK